MARAIVLRVLHQNPVRKWGALFVGSGFAAPALAADSSGGYTFVSVLMLLMLAVAVAALAWLMRRGAGGMSGAVSSMRVVAVQHLGPRERVVVLTVGSRHFMLGHTSHQVSMLAELSAEDLPVPAARIPENLFVDLLKKLKR